MLPILCEDEKASVLKTPLKVFLEVADLIKASSMKSQLFSKSSVVARKRNA